jgi:hypothetical protein
LSRFSFTSLSEPEPKAHTLGRGCYVQVGPGSVSTPVGRLPRLFLRAVCSRGLRGVAAPSVYVVARKPDRSAGPAGLAATAAHTAESSASPAIYDGRPPFPPCHGHGGYSTAGHCMALVHRPRDQRSQGGLLINRGSIVHRVSREAIFYGHLTRRKTFTHTFPRPPQGGGEVIVTLVLYLFSSSSQSPGWATTSSSKPSAS